jgi:hypothetical protein
MYQEESGNPMSNDGIDFFVGEGKTELRREVFCDVVPFPGF